MENLPSDVLLYLALDMDIQDVLRLCLTSKRFNDGICMNKNYWINRLKRDYDVNYLQEYGNPRVLFFDVRKYFAKLGTQTSFIPRKKYNLDDILNEAATTGNINIMKVAIAKGANPRRYLDGEPNEEDYEWLDEVPEAMELAVSSGHLEAFKFLLSLLGRELTQLQKDWVLVLAAGSGNIQIVKYLIEQLGARPDEKTIQEAKYMSHEHNKEKYDEIIKYLKSKLV